MMVSPILASDTVLILANTKPTSPACNSSQGVALGYQAPKATPCDELQAGEVGFVFANIKTVSDAKIGDTIMDCENAATEPLPGFEEIKPMVFAGLYPVESHEHGLLRDALEKLRLNDSAFNFEPENSVALGFGFRCGFLGLLHRRS